MHRSQSATTLIIGLLLACASSAAEERSVSSSQGYTIHVPKEVKFGELQPAAVGESAAQPTKDAAAVCFMAETTAGLTVQFETQSEPANKLPLKLSVGGRQQGSWWASEAQDVIASTRESVATATVVQASTLGAGWATLQIDFADPLAASDANATTIVVTIVAH